MVAHDNGEKEAKAPNPKKLKMTIAIIENGMIKVKRPRPTDRTEYFERALKLTKFGLFNYMMIFVCGVILANVLLETLGISFVLPVSECDFPLTTTQRGVLGAIGFAGIISSSHLWGFLADTTGRRNIIRPTLIMGFCLTVFSSFAQNFWVMVVLRYLNGFCVSGGSATVYAYLSEFHTSKHRSRAIMGAAIVFGIGSMLMPAVAWLVINQDWSLPLPVFGMVYKPWRLFMIVCGIPGFISGLALFKLPESPKFLLSQGKQAEALKVLRTIYHINSGNPKMQYPVTTVLIEDLNSYLPKENQHCTGFKALLRSMWQQTQPLFGRQYLFSTLLICIIQFVTFFTSNGLYIWFPDILNSVGEYMSLHPTHKFYLCDVVYEKQRNLYNFNEEMKYLEMFNVKSFGVKKCNEKLELNTLEQSLLLEILYAVGFSVLAVIINCVGKRSILFGCLVFCGLSGIAVIYTDIPLISTNLYLVLLLCGLGINVLSATTVEIYPTKLRAMAVCISLMMGRLGSVVGVNVFGTLLTQNCETAFVISGVTLILSGFLGFLIPSPSKFINQRYSRRSSVASMTGN
ncbi:synaptic vesicle glycoprotein 2A-like isoform X2 [Teleopsis dalmanni]|uniref:synaptic vesicle glycoprotein 2A-like isoform X2 n=1 Tax=Teleopsis dalmanni TaxID=139649 RepID=UPI0018CE2065|nr:synaptic vesicle glycoprotein 2A-like isoform X2 [Teleopsis dalmanni]